MGIGKAKTRGKSCFENWKCVLKRFTLPRLTYGCPVTLAMTKKPIVNTYRTEVINRTILRRRGVRDLSVRLRRHFSHPGKSSKCNGRLIAFGSVSSSETRSTTSEVEF